MLIITVADSFHHPGSLFLRVQSKTIVVIGDPSGQTSVGAVRMMI